MSRFAMCPNCGRRMKRLKDEFGYWDEESYYCENCASEDDEDYEHEISVYDAADIWASNGKDEDYMFGYSEDELNGALDAL